MVFIRLVSPDTPERHNLPASIPFIINFTEIYVVVAVSILFSYYHTFKCVEQKIIYISKLFWPKKIFANLILLMMNDYVQLYIFSFMCSSIFYSVSIDFLLSVHCHSIVTSFSHNTYTRAKCIRILKNRQNRLNASLCLMKYSNVLNRFTHLIEVFYFMTDDKKTHNSNKSKLCSYVYILWLCMF